MALRRFPSAEKRAERSAEICIAFPVIKDSFLKGADFLLGKMMREHTMISRIWQWLKGWIVPSHFSRDGSVDNESVLSGPLDNWGPDSYLNPDYDWMEG